MPPPIELNRGIPLTKGSRPAREPGGLARLADCCPGAGQQHRPLAAWREGQHDHLVLAIAVAAWHAEKDSSHLGGGRPLVIDTDRR